MTLLSLRRDLKRHFPTGVLHRKVRARRRVPCVSVCLSVCSQIGGQKNHAVDHSFAGPLRAQQRPFVKLLKLSSREVEAPEPNY